jgi:hypothetical protein
LGLEDTPPTRSKIGKLVHRLFTGRLALVHRDPWPSPSSIRRKR